MDNLGSNVLQVGELCQGTTPYVIATSRVSERRVVVSHLVSESWCVYRLTRDRFLDGVLRPFDKTCDASHSAWNQT